LADPRLRYSKGEVRRAGELLRAWALRLDGAEDEVAASAFPGLPHALGVTENWRGVHGRALQKAASGLRSRVTTVGAPLRVTQRLKRTVTIIDKLGREPGMRLDRMHDIAGCRAVVDSIEQLRQVQDRYDLRPPSGGVRRTYDYVERPKDSGYRGVHLVVVYDDRLVEVQLRTQVQHEWAHAVERIGSNLRVDVKSGQGPEPLLRFLRAVAEAMATEDNGGIVDDVLWLQIARLRDAASPYLQGGVM
jgi:putative GTP pyrophosphokinase